MTNRAELVAARGPVLKCRAACYYQGMAIQWYLMNLPPGHKLPKWKRTFGVSDSGTVFLPAAIAGNEQAVLLCAGYDGVEAATESNHLYVSTTWMAREYPATAEICAAAEKYARDNDLLKPHDRAD